MAKKVSREQVYREILESRGIRFEDCRMLSFFFSVESWAKLFHYGIMMERVRYHLFDSWGLYAVVIAPDDEANANAIIELATQNGGQKTTISMR